MKKIIPINDFEKKFDTISRCHCGEAPNFGAASPCHRCSPHSWYSRGAFCCLFLIYIVAMVKLLPKYSKNSGKNGYREVNQCLWLWEQFLRAKFYSIEACIVTSFSTLTRILGRCRRFGNYRTATASLDDMDKTGREPPNDEFETGLFLAKTCVGGGF